MFPDATGPSKLDVRNVKIWCSLKKDIKTKKTNLLLTDKPLSSYKLENEAVSLFSTIFLSFYCHFFHIA